MFRSIKTALFPCVFVCLLLAGCDSAPETGSAETDSADALGPIDPRAARAALVEAVEPFQQERWTEAGGFLAAASRHWPSHPEVLWLRVRVAEQQGETLVALDLLERLWMMRLALGARLDQLESLADEPRFQELRARFDTLEQVAEGASVPAFELREPDLIPESVVYDPVSDSFFVSSIRKRKIVRRMADGTEQDFARDRDGDATLYAVFGLAVDAERRRLWATTGGIVNMEDFQPEDDGDSALLVFDLDSGVMLRRVEIADEAQHRFNDVTVASDGGVYVSDNVNPGSGVYHLAPGTEVLQRLDPGSVDAAASQQVDSQQVEYLRSAQGLVLSADERILYLADYSYGLQGLELTSGTWFDVAGPDDLPLLAIDGLARHGNDLIAIQNGLRPHRVLRLRLSPDGRRVLAGERLQLGHPRFREPTLGTVVGDRFVYVANSQWDRFDREGRLAPLDELAVPLLLQLDLGADGTRTD